MEKDFRKHIGLLFFLFTFIVLRVGNFHVFSHLFDDDDHRIECKLCEVISESNDTTPFTAISIDIVVRKPQVQVSIRKDNFDYKPSNFSSTLPETVRNRPPPSFS